MGIIDYARGLFGGKISSRAVPVVTEVQRFGPPGGVVAAPPRSTNRRQNYPGVGADVDKLDAYIRRANDGYPRDLQDFFSDTLERDSRADAVCRTRAFGVASRPLNIVPPEGFETDKEAVEIARRVKVLLSAIKRRPTNPMTCSVKSALGAMARGAIRGWTVVEQEWGVSPEGYHAPVALHLRAANRFGFDDEMRFVRRDYSDPTEGVPLDTWGPDRFIVHIPSAGKGDEYPWRRPVLIPISWIALFKKSGVKGWLRACERMGSPIPYVVLPENQQHLSDDAVTFLRKLAAGTSAVFHGEIDVKKVEGSGDADGTPHRNLIDWCDTSQAIAALGQNLSTEVQGGSFAAANAQNTVRLDILAADADECSESLTHQSIVSIVKYNWPGAPTPCAVIDTSAQADWTLDDVKEGLCTEDEYRIQKGHGPKPDGSGSKYRTALSQVPAQLQPTTTPPGGAGGAASVFRSVTGKA